MQTLNREKKSSCFPALSTSDKSRCSSGGCGRERQQPVSRSNYASTAKWPRHPKRAKATPSSQASFSSGPKVASRPPTQTRHRGKRASLTRPRALDIRPLRLRHHGRSESDESGTKNHVNAHFDTAPVMREQLTSTEASETPLNSARAQ